MKNHETSLMTGSSGGEEEGSIVKPNCAAALNFSIMIQSDLFSYTPAQGQL
jgi:hypothetical protein